VDGPTKPYRILEAAECFIIEDASGIYRLAYIYFEDENPVRRREAGRLTKEQARKVAEEIAVKPSR